MFKKQNPPKPIRALMDPAYVSEFDQAEKLRAKSHPEQAAPIYVRLAVKAKTGKSPLQAGNLHAEAADAWLEAGNAQDALDQGWQAMGIFNELGLTKKAAEYKAQFAKNLRARGWADLADKFEREAGQILPVHIDTNVEIKRGQLPAECPQCGAPVRADRVEWINLHSAVCSFCGGTIKTTNE